MNELYHYGVLGMKWGVRRYQNKDGSLTAAGKKRNIETKRSNNVSKYKNDVEDIASTLSKTERKIMGMEDDEEYISDAKEVVSIFLEKHGNTPVSVFHLTDYGNGLNAVVATRSGDEYRGKGYADNVVKRGLEWYDKNKSQLNKPITWWAEKNNIGSQKLAEKNGFRKDPSLEISDDEWLKNKWVKYIYD